LSAQDTAGEATGAGEPSEEELRAAYEAELSRITATDMMAQAAVSLLNIGARRLTAPAAGETPGAGGDGGAGAGDAAAGGSAAAASGGTAAASGGERDLEQARDAIDAAKALLEILERRIPRELGPLRDALSHLQMTYAREIQPGTTTTAQAQGSGTAGGQSRPADPAGGGQGTRQPSTQPAGPGPAEASGRLWVPGR
jgi:hypothetical protein